ncbi:hypothetical protein HAX54_021025, partial [Datura stramonium]|nr:hypothetical protein [Datura stramonium]
RSSLLSPHCSPINQSPLFTPSRLHQFIADDSVLVVITPTPHLIIALHLGDLDAHAAVHRLYRSEPSFSGGQL